DLGNTIRYLAHTSAPLATDLRIPKAIHNVVVHHADGLHEGVADGRSYESEAAFLKVFAHGVGFRRSRGEVLWRSPGIYPRVASDTLRGVPVERAILVLNLQ